MLMQFAVLEKIFEKKLRGGKEEVNFKQVQRPKGNLMYSRNSREVRVAGR